MIRAMIQAFGNNEVDGASLEVQRYGCDKLAS